MAEISPPCPTTATATRSTATVPTVISMWVAASMTLSVSSAIEFFGVVKLSVPHIGYLSAVRSRFFKRRKITIYRNLSLSQRYRLS